MNITATRVRKFSREVTFPVAGPATPKRHMNPGIFLVNYSRSQIVVLAREAPAVADAGC